MTMRAFQPTRRRSQTHASSPPSATTVPKVPLSAPPPLPLLRSTPNLPPQPNPHSHPNPYPRPHLQSTPFLKPPPLPQLPANRPSSPEITELRPNHDIPGLHKFDKLLNFLLKHRPYHVPALINDCWNVYNTKYKKKKTPSSRHSLPSNQSEPIHQSQHADKSQLAVEPIDVDRPPSVHDPELVHSNHSPSHRNSQYPSRIPLFDRQAHLERLVHERWNTFHVHQQHPQNHDSQQETKSKEHFIVWQCPKSPSDPVLLDPENCCLALQDDSSNLSPIHLKALTFLWHNLIENPCTGAIFNHGIGYPRTHIIFLFAQLVLNSPGRQNNTILVVCPPAARAQWEMSHEHFLEKVTINILTKSQWQENINQWRERGGVLVADDDTYANILQSDASPEKRSALSALCCPGPDICILDEAAKTNTRPAFPQFRRFLYRTRTKARLALTSLPLAGFIARAWSIVDWACPYLFGTNIEYHSNFVYPIARGHECNSTTEETSDAFRKACLLFNKMSMITFTIDSSTRRESLFSKGLSLHESIVWVNISREEYAIYREVELFLGKAVREKGFSPFLAVELMICAASSVHALRRTVNTWANSGPRCLQPIGDQAQELFLQLRHIMDSRLKENLTCTKMQLALYVGRECLKTNERLVIFSSSQDLLEEVHRFLASQLDERKVYTYNALTHSQSRKSLPLDDFNTVQGGAILTAPYGPTIHCMEESGWGFINATRVLFIDSSWHSGACVQAVNRVHNFAQMSSDLHVHHFLARDTVEDDLSSVLERRYKHIVSCDSSSPLEMISGIDEKGFLIAPEVTPRLIRDNPPQDISRSAASSVKRLNTDEQENSSATAEHDDIILPLRNTTDTATDDHYVHEIILNSDRYRIMSENLDLWMRSKWSNKLDFNSEPIVKTTYKELISFHRESLHVFGGDVIDAIRGGLDGEWLAQDCIFMEEDMRVSHLLTSWEPYRRLFECAQVLDLPRPPKSRGEKRPRPYDEDERYSKNLRCENDL